VAMDEAHLGAALRYVALNPVRARLVKRADEWRWSSVHAQLGKAETPAVTDTAPVRARYPDFAALVAEGEDEDMSEALRQAETIGRPLGDARFLARLERRTGRRLKPRKRGPKAREPELSALSP